MNKNSKRAWNKIDFSLRGHIWAGVKNQSLVLTHKEVDRLLTSVSFAIVKCDLWELNKFTRTAEVWFCKTNEAGSKKRPFSATSERTFLTLLTFADVKPMSLHSCNKVYVPWLLPLMCLLDALLPWDELVDHRTLWPHNVLMLVSVGKRSCFLMSAHIDLVIVFTLSGTGGNKALPEAFHHW